MWVLIDNYDSFTYILHHYLLQASQAISTTGKECIVFRNDEITIPELIELKPERIIISPGPETPLQAGITLEAIKFFHDKIPLLGICLGHQAVGMFFGASLLHAPYPMHGKTSRVRHTNHPIFKEIPETFEVMRYHSLILDPLENENLEVIAIAEDDHSIMAIAHKNYNSIGLQFHPESIGTKEGRRILQNWARMY